MFDIQKYNSNNIVMDSTVQALVNQTVDLSSQHHYIRIIIYLEGRNSQFLKLSFFNNFAFAVSLVGFL